MIRLIINDRPNPVERGQLARNNELDFKSQFSASVMPVWCVLQPKNFIFLDLIARVITQQRNVGTYSIRNSGQSNVRIDKRTKCSVITYKLYRTSEILQRSRLLSLPTKRP